MTDSDLGEVLAVYAAYRGQRLEEGSVEVREFVAIFAGAIRENVEAAIRAAAEQDGRVFLETVARRHREVCEGKLSRAIADKVAERNAALVGASGGAVQYARPGWPCAAGSPVASYLTWISARAMWGPVAAKTTAARYVAAGLVTAEQAEYVIGCIPLPGVASAEARSRAGKEAVEACERAMGSWARCSAEEAIRGALARAGTEAPESAGRAA